METPHPVDTLNAGCLKFHCGKYQHSFKSLQISGGFDSSLGFRLICACLSFK